MQWTDLDIPSLEESYFHKNEIKECLQWIEDYRNNVPNTPKVLMIIGHTGSGKTKLAHLLIKQYQYSLIEYNSSDIRSQKKIVDVLKKTLCYKNVIDMFNDNNLPVAILMDEIDSICKTGDKGGLSEFLYIVKMNSKYEIYKKEKTKEKKKKVKKSALMNEDFIHLYNPIICTTNDINDKKINELKKFSKVIYLKRNLESEIQKFIPDIYRKKNINISHNAIESIMKLADNDIRRLLILMEDIYQLSEKEWSNNLSTERLIDEQIINIYNKIQCGKDSDYQLIDATYHIFYSENSYDKNTILFDIDCLLLPLMIYHNSILVIKKSKDDIRKRLNIYKNIMYSLSYHDTIQTNIFEFQDWHELYTVATFYGSVLPNYYSNQLSDSKNPEFQAELQFTNILNKISQMFTNKKLMNSAKYGIHKIDMDIDEIIYLVDIVSQYLEEFKQNYQDSSSDDETDDESENNLNADESILIDESMNGELNKKNIVCDNMPMLIKIMNRYKISIEALENLLKIEKLNQQNEKKKKKFTITLKKEIAKFLNF